MPDRVMLLAIDGLDGGRVRALVEAGRCPALARLLREGAYADVAVTSCTPGLADPNRAMNSPTLWTTVATGQHYFQHGVHDFSNMLDSIEHPPLFESRHVQSPRIWDVLSSRGLAGVVVGYYVTHPAYPITGVMVSDLFGETDEAGVVSPPALLGELVGVLGADGYAAYRARLGTLGAEQTMRDTPVPSSNDDAMSLTRDVLRRFADLTEQQAASLLGDEGLKSVLRLLEHRLVYPYLRDDRMHRMFLHLVKSMDWRFAVCYYRIIDFVSHGFLGGAPGLPADFRQPFNRTLDHAYECVDNWIAEARASLNPADRLMVLSDHGFTVAKQSELPDVQEDNAEPTGGEHAEPAFLTVAGGPRPGRFEHLTLLDIAPTILDFFGIEQAESLDGGPVPDLLTENASRGRARISDYPYDRPTSTARLTADEDEVIRRRLAALGYLEA